MAESVTDAVQQLNHNDNTLKQINLHDCQLTDAQLAELADCLLAHPHAVATVWLDGNRLTDETGVKLAQFLAASSTIEWLDLSNNQFGTATYLALAAALRANSSLQHLYFRSNQAVDRRRIDAAFVEALWVNPDRPAGSEWWLYSTNWFESDFKRLKHVAGEGHPSLQLLLAARLLRDDRQTSALWF